MPLWLLSGDDIFYMLSTVYSSYSRNLESRYQRTANKYSQKGKVSCKTFSFMMCLPKILFSWSNYALLNLKFNLKMMNLPSKDWITDIEEPWGQWNFKLCWLDEVTDFWFRKKKIIQLIYMKSSGLVRWKQKGRELAPVYFTLNRSL